MLFPLEGILGALFHCTSQKLNFLSCLNPETKYVVLWGREYMLKGIMKRGLLNVTGRPVAPTLLCKAE